MCPLGKAQSVTELLPVYQIRQINPTIYKLCIVSCTSSHNLTIWSLGLMFNYVSRRLLLSPYITCSRFAVTRWRDKQQAAGHYCNPRPHGKMWQISDGVSYAHILVHRRDSIVRLLFHALLLRSQSLFGHCRMFSSRLVVPFASLLFAAQLAPAMRARRQAHNDSEAGNCAVLTTVLTKQQIWHTAGSGPPGHKYGRSGGSEWRRWKWQRQHGGDGIGGGGTGGGSTGSARRTNTRLQLCACLCA